MARSYRTAQGKSVDIEKLRLKNELVPAVGNMRVNARGDQLGPGGKVVKSREQMLDDHYNSTVRKNRADDGADEIPTSSSKIKKAKSSQPQVSMPDIDIFEEEPADPDPIIIQDKPTEEPKPAPKKRTAKKKTQPVAEAPTVNITEELTITQEPVQEPVQEPKSQTAAFEFTGDTEESVTKDPIPANDPTTGFSKGGKALKGGLAKAVAKTREYEKQKNPGPKRM